jgi:hypothetical protein
MGLKGILITIILVAALGAGGFVLYNVAYAFGDADGYDKGYTAGQKVGYSSGSQDGYSEGYDTGVDDGYNQGAADGYDSGYTAGYAEGLGVGTEHGLCLRDPSYAEALAFMKSDHTDRNRWDEDSYVCSHFARDVCNNAEAGGLRCAFVELRYEDSGHSIIAFDTIDKGIIYFEPQFDDEVEVAIGRSYAQLNSYATPDYDDVIRDVVVIW